MAAEIKIGGEVKHLKIRLKEAQLVEMAFGNTPILNLLANPSMAFVIHSLWAGLKWDDETLTLDDVTEMVERDMEGGKTIVDMTRLIRDVYEASGFIAATVKKYGKKARGNETAPEGEAPAGAAPKNA